MAYICGAPGPCNSDHMQHFSASQAAEVCDVDRTTIQRKLKRGSFPNAEKSADGAWQIPLADLLADGLNPGAPRPGDAPQAQSTDAPQGDATEVPVAMTQVPQAELEQLRRRLAVAEALLDERQERISDLQLMLRQIEAAKPARSEIEAAEGQVLDLREGLPTSAESPQGRRRWWRRRSVD